MAVFVWRSTSVLAWADRRCRLPETDKASRQSSARYDGARPFMHLNTVIANLKIVRWRTGSQCDAWFPSLRCRSRMRFRSRFRIQAGTEKIELDPIWTDERQRRTYGNGERYFYVGLLCYENGYVTVEISHKSCKTGVMWLYFLVPDTTRAAAFWTSFNSCIAGRRRCHTANCCRSQDDYWQTRVWASWLLLWSATIGLAWADAKLPSPWRFMPKFKRKSFFLIFKSHVAKMGWYWIGHFGMLSCHLRGFI